MSVIIVGVGDELFELMKDMDTRKKPLRDSRGRVVYRDFI